MNWNILHYHVATHFSTENDVRNRPVAQFNCRKIYACNCDFQQIGSVQRILIGLIITELVQNLIAERNCITICLCSELNGLIKLKLISRVLRS